MTKEILYEILSSKSERLSSADIEGILNEELDKSPEEMDTDLIDLCIDALNNPDEKQLNKKRVKIRLTKVLLAAVIFVLIIGFSIPVCANHFNVRFSDTVIRLYRDYFYVQISDNDVVYDIDTRLEEEGIANSCLPWWMYDNQETRITDFYSADVAGVGFSFKHSDISGTVNINELNAFEGMPYWEYRKFPSDIYNMTHIEVNGIDVLIYSLDDNRQIILYDFNNIEYHIEMNCDYDTAYKLAEVF